MTPHLVRTLVPTSASAPLAADGETPHEALAPRLQELLTHMSEGASRPEIGRRLGISESTRSHSKAIFERLGVNQPAHAVAIGVPTGLIK